MKPKRKYNKIKAVLAEKNVTGKELAKFLGRTESTISRWCTNDIQPSIPIMYEIADYLNIDVKKLLI